MKKIIVLSLLIVSVVAGARNGSRSRYVSKYTCDVVHLASGEQMQVTLKIQQSRIPYKYMLVVLVAAAVENADVKVTKIPVSKVGINSYSNSVIHFNMIRGSVGLGSTMEFELINGTERTTMMCD